MDVSEELPRHMGYEADHHLCDKDGLGMFVPCLRPNSAQLLLCMPSKTCAWFPAPTSQVGLRIWNYNPNLDESFMGVKWLKVEADSQLLSPEQGFLVRKAPGSDLFDYGQTIYFDDDRAHSPRNGSPKAKGSGRWVSGSPKGDNAGRSGFSAQPQSKPDIMTLNDSVGSTGGDDDQFVHADFDTLLGTNDNDRRWGGGAAGSMDNGDQSLGVEELEWPLVEVSQAPQQ